MRKLCLLFSVLGLSSFAAADNSWANITSTTGTYAYIGLGLGLTYFRDGDFKVDHTLRVADSGFCAFLLTEGMKSVIHSPGPQASDGNSFPSTHTATAFAVASMLSHYHPNEAPLWYAGAATIGFSRVVIKAHRPSDVLAGAAIGYGITQLEIHAPRGLLISPFVAPTDRGLMLSVKGTW